MMTNGHRRSRDALATTDRRRAAITSVTGSCLLLVALRLRVPSRVVTRRRQVPPPQPCLYRYLAHTVQPDNATAVMALTTGGTGRWPRHRRCRCSRSAVMSVMGLLVGILLPLSWQSAWTTTSSSSSSVALSDRDSTAAAAAARLRQPPSADTTGAKQHTAPPASAPPPPVPGAPPTDDELADTAIVTMATGDPSARDAVALIQSLRDVGTRIPRILVLLVRGGVGSADCHNLTAKTAVGRQEVACHELLTIAPEIASARYLDVFTALGAETVVVDPIPDTPFTVIPGGRQIFWGMAFNKLLVFNMTQFRKVLWLDSDAFVVRNIDHLVREPMLTGAFVTACCHPAGGAMPGGGLWVVEPSAAVMADILDLIAHPVPGTDSDPWYVLFGGWGQQQRFTRSSFTLHHHTPQLPLAQALGRHARGAVLLWRRAAQGRGGARLACRARPAPRLRAGSTLPACLCKCVAIWRSGGEGSVQY